MKSYWTLDGRRAVPGASLVEWVRIMADLKGRTVERTEVGDWYVSTVFLGTNHNLGDGPPLLAPILRLGAAIGRVMGWFRRR